MPYTVPSNAPITYRYLVRTDNNGYQWAEIPDQWLTWFAGVDTLMASLSTDLGDLTDGGDTVLHYHLADRIHARNHALYRV